MTERPMCTVQAVLTAFCLAGAAFLIVDTYAKPVVDRTEHEFCLELAHEAVQSYYSKLLTAPEATKLVKKCVQGLR